MSRLLLLLTATGVAGSCDDPVACYFEDTDYTVSVAATAGNPFKGFATNPEWSAAPYRQEIPSSIEFHYVPLSDVMTGDDTFDWTALEALLDASAGRLKHSVLRFFVDHPNDPTVNTPDNPETSRGAPRFFNPALAFNSYAEHGGGHSPDYHDNRLIIAFEQFAAALGSAYDGDTRIAVVQIGLVGFWGEWHTYPDMAWMPSVEDQTRIITAFDLAFATTQLELRSPTAASAGAMVGYHDDSFTHSTLDGAANGRGGEPPIAWFQNRVKESTGAADSWMHSSVGGEVRVENQATVFDADFRAAGTDFTFKQDFGTCVAETHTSWMLNYHAYAADLGYSGDALVAAQAGAAAMGYQFEIDSVAVCADADTGVATITVTVANTGVAPFYYPLVAVLEVASGCGGNGAGVVEQNDAKSLKLLQPAETQSFEFSVPTTDSSCVTTAGVRLDSSHTYDTSPVNLAHTHIGGPSGGTVVALGAPAPPTPCPSPSPTPSPTPADYCPPGYGDYGTRYNWGLGKITLVTTHTQCSDRCTQFSGPQFAGGCKAYMTGMYFGMLFCRSYGGNLRTQPCPSWAVPTDPGFFSGALGSSHAQTNQVNIGGNCCSNVTFVGG